jgi:heme a synthase
MDNTQNDILKPHRKAARTSVGPCLVMGLLTGLLTGIGAGLLMGPMGGIIIGLAVGAAGTIALARRRFADSDADRDIGYQPWLHVYVWVSILFTLGLILLGGTVTSRDAGLAVPDWPTTYNYNMFVVPLDMWIGKGNVFWEHSHRLLGSIVGMLTVGLTLWLLVTQRHRRWLQVTGFGLLVLVVIQGFMGGMRVTELSDVLAVVHGITAQVFFCLLFVVAAATSRLWLRHTAKAQHQRHAADSANDRRIRAARVPAALLLIAMFVQLALGATMRHTTRDGLAIPDFPTTYGRLVPPVTQEGIHEAFEAYWADVSYEHIPPYEYNVAQVGVHFAHRVWAVAVVAAAVFLVFRLGSAVRQYPALAKPLAGYFALMVVQIALGAGIIWSEKHPELATAHQTIGAIMLATATVLLVRVWLIGSCAAQLRTGFVPATAKLNFGGAGA